MRSHTLLSICLLSVSLASSASLNDRQTVEVESKSLDELYKLALAEGGNLIVKAGGDEKNRQDDKRKAFEQQFPGLNVSITVDLSKVLFSCISSIV